MGGERERWRRKKGGRERERYRGLRRKKER